MSAGDADALVVMAGSATDERGFKARVPLRAGRAGLSSLGLIPTGAIMTSSFNDADSGGGTATPEPPDPPRGAVPACDTNVDAVTRLPSLS